MQQRVSLVRGFALGAPILLMDEPFAALDEITRAEMRYLLLDLWQRTGHDRRVRHPLDHRGGHPVRPGRRDGGATRAASRPSSRSPSDGPGCPRWRTHPSSTSTSACCATTCRTITHERATHETARTRVAFVSIRARPRSERRAGRDGGRRRVRASTSTELLAADDRRARQQAFLRFGAPGDRRGRRSCCCGRSSSAMLRRPAVRAAGAVGHPASTSPAIPASTSATVASRCGRRRSASSTALVLALARRHGDGALAVRRAGVDAARRAHPGDADHRLRAGDRHLARLRAQVDPRDHVAGVLRAVPRQLGRRLPLGRPEPARTGPVGRRPQACHVLAAAGPVVAAVPVLRGPDRRRPRARSARCSASSSPAARPASATPSRRRRPARSSSSTSCGAASSCSASSAPWRRC